MIKASKKNQEAFERLARRASSTCRAKKSFKRLTRKFAEVKGQQLLYAPSQIKGQKVSNQRSIRRRADRQQSKINVARLEIIRLS